MSVAEFVARMRPGSPLPPLIDPQREYYYMQAELSPRLLAMTRLDLPPFVRPHPGRFGGSGQEVGVVGQVGDACQGVVAERYYCSAGGGCRQVLLLSKGCLQTGTTAQRHPTTAR